MPINRPRLPMKWCLLVAMVATAITLGAPFAHAQSCKIVEQSSSCGSAQLCAEEISDELEYDWRGPGGFRSSKPCIDVDVEGRYRLTVTSKKTKKSSECSIDVKIGGKGPNCEITGKRAFCPDSTTELCGPEGKFTYTWSFGGQVISTGRCITVSEPGTYTLQLSDGDCSSTCTADVVHAPSPDCEATVPPECTILGAALSCGPSRLCPATISDQLQYLWTGPGGFSANTPCIDATADGHYLLRVSASTGEFDTCGIDVKILPLPPCGIEGKRTFCSGDSTILCGPDAPLFTYRWLFNGQTISTERCLEVREPGTYALEVFNGECRDTCFATTELGTGAECGGEPEPGLCWMTGGGSQAVEGRNGRGKKDFDWGGNVNPGCSPTAGDGGNWNHVDRILNLHFQGRSIRVVRCGNVDGIPPGSTSPKTPVNFIEFEGVGRLMGHAGNPVETDPEVFFWARVEDRAEPGSHGQPNLDARDRYFLHVFGSRDNRNGTTLLLVDEDADPATIDPIVVDHGNLQLHISGCDKRGGTEAFGAPAVGPIAELESAPRSVSLGAPRPNPASRNTFVAFALPRDAGVSVAVHDITGRRVRELASGYYPAGDHQLVWDFSDGEGRRVPGGVYFIRLVTEGRTYQRSVTVIQ